MPANVADILRAFEHLSEPEKKDLAAEILRRSVQWEWPALSDEDLVLNAEQLFLELDKTEADDA
jgi:hypothetical protein